jgi:hypothetical protein
MTNPDQHDQDQQREHEDARRGGLVRRVLNQGPSPEQRLEELLAHRRTELEEHAARLREPSSSGVKSSSATREHPSSAC